MTLGQVLLVVVTLGQVLPLVVVMTLGVRSPVTTICSTVLFVYMGSLPPYSKDTRFLGSNIPRVCTASLLVRTDFVLVST